MNILTIDLPTRLTSFDNMAIAPQCGSDGDKSLITCHVAGTTHRDLQDLLPLLLPGDLFSLRREPGNDHDEAAIAVYDERGNHLGYIPRRKNEILARLLDAGVSLGARLLEKEKLPNVTGKEWVRLNIAVFVGDVMQMK